MTLKKVADQIFQAAAAGDVSQGIKTENIANGLSQEIAELRRLVEELRTQISQKKSFISKAIGVVKTILPFIKKPK